MTKRYQYKIFPETTKARLLVAGAFVAGLLLIAGYAVFWLSFYGGGPFGWLEFWDKIEVTYVNETDQTVAVYIDNDVVATVPPGESVTHSYRKVEWWWHRKVVVRDLNGRLIYATELDKGDLEDIDYRIVIQE